MNYMWQDQNYNPNTLILYKCFILLIFSCSTKLYGPQCPWRQTGWKGGREAKKTGIRSSPSEFGLFFLVFIYLFVYYLFIYLFRLHRVLVAECGLLVAAWGLLSCSTWTLSYSMWTSYVQHAGSSSPTSNRTQAPCIGSTESYPLDHQGSPWPLFLMN